MGQLSHRVDIPFPLFDADNHLYEPRGGADQVPAQGVQGRRPVRAGQRPHEDRDPRADQQLHPEPHLLVVAKPGAWEEYFKFGNPDGKSKRELFGEPMRSIPAFFEPAPRLELMNELGLDRSLMFPTLASLVEERLRDDPVAIHVIMHALNEWLDEVWGFNYQNRIFTTPVITLPIVEKAIEELDWVVKRGARAILIRPAPVPGFRGPRSFALPEFDPFWQKCVEYDVLVAMHSSDSGYSRYTSEWDGADPGDAAVPDQRDVHPQRVAPDSGRGGLVGDSRRAVPVPDAQGRGHRGRVEVDVPAARQHGRGLEEGAGGVPGQPDRGDQEPHPRQPVLRGGHRRPDQPHRRGAACSTAPTTRIPRVLQSRRTT